VGTRIFDEISCSIFVPSEKRTSISSSIFAPSEKRPIISSSSSSGSVSRGCLAKAVGTRFFTELVSSIFVLSEKRTCRSFSFSCAGCLTKPVGTRKHFPELDELIFEPSEKRTCLLALSPDNRTPAAWSPDPLLLSLPRLDCVYILCLSGTTGVLPAAMPSSGPAPRSATPIFLTLPPLLLLLLAPAPAPAPGTGRASMRYLKDSATATVVLLLGFSCKLCAHWPIVSRTSSKAARSCALSPLRTSFATSRSAT